LVRIITYKFIDNPFNDLKINTNGLGNKVTVGLILSLLGLDYNKPLFKMLECNFAKKKISA
jgi:hypothetical protein